MLAAAASGSAGVGRPKNKAVVSASSRLGDDDDEEDQKRKKRKTKVLKDREQEEPEQLAALEDQDAQGADDGKGRDAASFAQLEEEDPDIFIVAQKHGELSKSRGKITFWWQLRVEKAFYEDFDGRTITAALWLTKLGNSWRVCYMAPNIPAVPGC